MADELDRAEAYMEQMQTAAIANVLAKAPEQALCPKGICYNCDEPLAAGRPFCDADCREDYDRARSAQQRNGR